MKICALAAGTLLLGAATALSAAEFDYSYLDAGYSRQQHPDLSGGDGYRVDGAYAFSGRPVYLYGEYGQDSFDASPYSYRNERYELGGGVHLPLSPSLAVEGRLTFGHTESKANIPFYCFRVCTSKLGSSGFGLALGLRYAPAASWELEVLASEDSFGFNYFPYAGHSSVCGNSLSVNCRPPGGAVDPGASETSLTVGARYAITRPLSLGVQYRRDWLPGWSYRPASIVFTNGAESMNEWLLYLRWNFGST